MLCTFQKSFFTCFSVDDNSLKIGIQDLPTEVLLRIFLYSSAKQLGLCSQVCVRWKDIVDSIFKNDDYWQQECIKDFGKLAKIAYYKKLCSTWCGVYRSLALWPRLARSKETRIQFAVNKSDADKIYGIQVLSNGVISVHRERTVYHYNLKDYEPFDKLTGCYLKYFENVDTMIFLDQHFHLFVLRKYITQKYSNECLEFDNIKIFQLINRCVYFVDWNHDLSVCDLSESELTTTVLTTVPRSLVTITEHNNNIYILTLHCNVHVYETDTKKMYVVENLKNVANPLNVLRKYGFLNDTDQQAYFPWINVYILGSMEDALIRDLTCIKTYGNVVFVGTKYGNLKIFYIKANEDMALVEKKPIKEYNFAENGDLHVRVHQIDVLEGDDEHTVLVALEHKIVVLKFSHFKKVTKRSTKNT